VTREETRVNLNTILLGITMAILGWVGITVYSTSLAVARMEERVISMSADIQDTETRLHAAEVEIVNLRLAKLR
jgi:hypothetical protein